ncbi:CgeB family protein [Bacillus suaedaesalsae]|uniref:Glycosyltransferase n=1 Tax=Bacillus suaedaesalsae TaxID=2810349 RepID=A0ABS2DL89_9BACI|nr:glycosyltransferase [Bacillus suaedaesalsae]MBM6618238.1 glycosyltransferase [Bacillus suaedaesalsae]
MRILLIISGYKGIYPYLEKSIKNALELSRHSWISISPELSNQNIEIIKHFQPDLAVSIVGYNLDKELIKFLQQLNIKFGLWLTEDPFYIDSSIKLIEDINYIFTIDLGAYEFYKRNYPLKNIYHLPLGTDPSLYFPIQSADKVYDICIVGYPYPERVDIVNQILDNTTFTIILVGPTWKRYLTKQKLKSNIKIINKWLEPEKVREIFNYSKIIINSHRSHQFSKNKNSLGIENKSINNRTFDIAANGGFQLISYKQDLGFHFNRNNEIIPFTDNKECLHLIDFYLENEELRDNYSNNARERVLNEHTFEHRLTYLIKCICEN